MTKKFFHDIDLNNTGQLLGARVQNVTNLEMAALGTTLGLENTGLVVWNTDQGKQYTWSGSAFVAASLQVSNDVRFQGQLIVYQDPTDPFDTLRADVPFPLTGGEMFSLNPILHTKIEENGVVTYQQQLNQSSTPLFINDLSFFLDFYGPDGLIFQSTRNDSNSGVGGNKISVNDSVLFLFDPTSGGDGFGGQNSIRVLQGNVNDQKIAETFDLIPQIIQRILSAEAEDVKIIQDLSSLRFSDRKIAASIRALESLMPRQFSGFLNVTQGSNVFTHTLGLVDPWAFVASFKDIATNEEISFEVKAIDANSLEIISLFDVGQVAVYVVGQSETTNVSSFLDFLPETSGIIGDPIFNYN